MNPNERRAKEKAAVRGKILDAARALFVKKGYEAVTMRGVAQKIGYTATALYYHFPDKEALMRELCEEDFLALAGYLKRMGRIACPVERLRKIAVTYVNFALENPQQYLLMFMTPRPHPAPEAFRIERGNADQDGYAFLLRTVQEAICGGHFRPEISDAASVALMLWSGLHGLVTLHLTMADNKWVEWRPVPETARLFTQTLLQGLLRPGGKTNL